LAAVFGGYIWWDWWPINSTNFRLSGTFSVNLNALVSVVGLSSIIFCILQFSGVFVFLSIQSEQTSSLLLVCNSTWILFCWLVTTSRNVSFCAGLPRSTLREWFFVFVVSFSVFNSILKFQFWWPNYWFVPVAVQLLTRAFQTFFHSLLEVLFASQQLPCWVFDYSVKDRVGFWNVP